MGRGEAGAVARLHVPLADRGVATQPRKRRSASKRITLRQASNMMAGVAFARQIGTPLNAHATIHWAGTKVGDDPDGRLFARSVKASTSGLSDRASLADCPRYGCASDFQVVSAEVVHCHMLFHLAHPFLGHRKLLRVVRALERLIDRHGGGNYGDYTLKITFPLHPDGLYLIKGGGPDVWRKFAVPRCWHKPQGVISGKRCGTTQNIGPSARKRHGIQRASFAG